MTTFQRQYSDSLAHFIYHNQRAVCELRSKAAQQLNGARRERVGADIIGTYLENTWRFGAGSGQ